jgi:hypothetical protein
VQQDRPQPPQFAPSVNGEVQVCPQQMPPASKSAPGSRHGWPSAMLSQLARRQARQAMPPQTRGVAWHLRVDWVDLLLVDFVPVRATGDGVWDSDETVSSRLRLELSGKSPWGEPTPIDHLIRREHALAMLAGCFGITTPIGPTGIWLEAKRVVLHGTTPVPDRPTDRDYGRDCYYGSVDLQTGQLFFCRRVTCWVK